MEQQGSPVNMDSGVFVELEGVNEALFFQKGKIRFEVVGIPMRFVFIERGNKVSNHIKLPIFKRGRFIGREICNQFSGIFINKQKINSFFVE